MTEASGSQDAVRSDRHSTFVQLYESFLDAAYWSPSDKNNNRWKLVRGILKELATRNVRTVLDCAAGTGFPAIDLADHRSLGDVKIHATDADVEMLEVFADRVRQKRRVTMQQFAPPRDGLRLGCDSPGSLRLAWHELAEIRRTYDYVMCRGNSLAYGNTWGGGREVSSADAVSLYLSEMKRLVRPGGYLHVDAPRRLELPKQCYQPLDIGGLAVSEAVTNEPDCRRWSVSFALPTGETHEFDRYSTRLTISDVKAMLDDLGFEQTEPRSLYGERSGFGVIIARRPERAFASRS